jgi:pimeloyl-ACP methyl ester carboxylesterase
VESGVTRNGDVQIGYEDFGAPGGRPLLLISGLDSQMIGWPDGFCAALAAAAWPSSLRCCSRNGSGR